MRACARSGNARRGSCGRSRRRGRDRCRSQAAPPRPGCGIAVPAWIALGVSLGAAPLGPLALVATALEPHRLTLARLRGVGWRGVGLATAWVALAASRAEPRSRRRAAGHASRGACRRRSPRARAARAETDLRLATRALPPSGSPAPCWPPITDARSPAPFLLGTTTALLGSVLCPLVVGGVLGDGPLALAKRAGAEQRDRAGRSRSRAPARRRSRSRSWACGAESPRAAARESPASSPRSSSSARGSRCSRCALLPWRGSGAGDQLTTIAAFAAIAIAASLRRRRWSPRGSWRSACPTPVIVVAIGVALLTAAIAALDHRLGAGGG